MAKDNNLTAALERVKVALAAMGSGNPQPYIDCWAKSDDATLFGAWGPIEKGYQRLTETFRWVGGRFKGGPLVPDNTVVFSSGDLAYTVGFERGEFNIDGGAKQLMTIRVTHIYRRFGDEWQLVHRHADFPQRISGRSHSRGRGTMSTEEFQEVLYFWFPQHLSDEHAVIVRQFEWWFGGGADVTIAERFPLLLERAARGELDHWAREPRSRLALILVLDQFSRSLYRGTAQAFAQDRQALALTQQGIAIGHYATLETPWEKTFFFLPLGHSEELVHLDVAVTLAEELVNQAPAALHRMLEHSVTQARGHRDVIARFGRHPHRNAILEAINSRGTRILSSRPIRSYAFVAAVARGKTLAQHNATASKKETNYD